MVKAVVFADLCKAACDILDDDYTTKYLLKAKTAKVPFPQLGPVKFTIENEAKGAKGVEGKLTAGFSVKGVSVDKLTLKGDKYALEASKTVSGVKCKLKGNPLCPDSAAVSAEYKTPTAALTASADKEKFGASAVGALSNFGLVGADVCSACGNVSYNLGASCIYSGLFAAVTYSSKAVASFALSFSPAPKVVVAATFDTADAATVGLKYDCCSDVKLGVKTTKDASSAVMVYKMKDSSLALSATSKYADFKPCFGMQLTIG